MSKYESVTSVMNAAKDPDFNMIAELSKKNACTKDFVILLCSHLYNELAGKLTAIDTLTASFEKTLANITEKNIKGIVEPIQESIKEVQTSIQNMSPLSQPSAVPKPNPSVNHPESITEPYAEYVEGFLETDLERDLLESFEDLPFKDIGGQREVYYSGEYKYKYTGGVHEPAPHPGPIKQVIDKVINAYPGTIINSCLASKYVDGSSFCPEHSDNERSLHPNSDIFTLSFGADRPMEYTRVDKKGNKRTILLQHNSLLVSSRKSQAYWKHAIPVSNATGPRYSLTLRANSPFSINSTVIFGDSNTKYLKFGEGEGTFGRWMPGERVKTQRIRDIPAVKDIAPYQNIVIHTGVNDVNQRDRDSAEDLVYQLQQKCREIHDVYPSTKIFISPLLPTKSPELNRKIWQVNEGIVRLRRQHHNLIVIDNSMFADNADCLRAEYGSYMNPQDSIHLGKTGLKAFAESLKSYVMGKNLNITKSLNYGTAYKSGQAFV